MSDSVYLKFKDNVKETVTLLYNQPLESEAFGKVQYIYGIVEYITGETKFNATEKLHEKIQSFKVGEGDSIYITKIKDPNMNSGYAFFKVEIPENAPVKQEVELSEPIDKGTIKFEKQFDEPNKKPDENLDKKLENHELSLRVEKLENVVNILWKDYGQKTSDAGHKPGDENI